MSAPAAARWVVCHGAGPRWQRGVAAFEQDGAREHAGHYRALLDEGKLVLGGPFLDDEGGGLMIVAEGVDHAELVAFAAADPAVRSGLLTVAVRPWFVGLRADG